MLVLSRKVNEEIVIGNNIRVSVVRISGNRIRLGISAPDNVSIRRAEVAFETHELPCDLHHEELAEIAEFVLS
ncbi:MAG: carbon storage regulator [Planctomycetes bacterium]|nr:carbon storage regulator [Planctomycetota bacterium]